MQTDASVVASYPYAVDFTTTKDPGEPTVYILTIKDGATRTHLTATMGSQAAAHLASAILQAAKAEQIVDDSLLTEDAV